MILAMLQLQIFPALRRGVALGNTACNLSCNGATKLQDKLQEKLPSVTAPLSTIITVHLNIKNVNLSWLVLALAFCHVEYW